MNPYLKTNRLQDVIAALQIMGSYRQYKMSAEQWKEKIENDPLSAETWSDVFKEHPEFFRENYNGLFSLMWERGCPIRRIQIRENPWQETKSWLSWITALQFHA